MGYSEDNESADSLLQQHGRREDWRAPVSKTRKWQYLLTFVNIVLFVSSAAFFLAGRSAISRPNVESWLHQTSYYSPLWNTALEEKLEKVNKEMDGSLFIDPNPSPFRNALSPSPEVEAAWAEIEWIRTFPITSEDVRKIGKDPELAVKFPSSYGFGDDAYVAQLDIFHQLHCLNLLRHIAWGEFDRDGKTAKRPYSDLHWIHVAHCTEILRENLMCSANLDVITFNWKETQDLPFADFNLNKKCTNAEVLFEWQKENALATEVSRNFTRPQGAKEVPIGDEYFRIFGVEKVDLHHGEAHEHSYATAGAAAKEISS